MAKAKKTSKSKRTTRVSQYRPSNLALFVIVLLLVALGTVTWLFILLVTTPAA